jgi:dihydrofolate reductase
MTAPRFRIYIAASLDGYIATPDGGVEWLAPFQAADYGFDAFLASVDTALMGRATYEQAIGFCEGWPYAGKRGVVLSSREIEGLPEGVERRSGEVAPIAEALRNNGGGDVWIVGGARVVRDFLDAGLVDEIDLFLIPRLLGDGVPLFAKSPRQADLHLVDTQPLPGGVVRLLYRLAA